MTTSKRATTARRGHTTRKTKTVATNKQHQDVSRRPLFEPTGMGSINPEVIREAVTSVVGERKAQARA